MPTFKDVNGREYLLRLDGPALGAVRKETGIRLGVFDPNAFNEMADDYEQLINVLWVLVRKQASDAGISDVQFGESMYGDHLEQAAIALREAWLDFFPSRKRSLLRSLGERQAAVLNQGMEELEAEFQKPEVLGQLQQKVRETVQKHLQKIGIGSASATSSPASSESILPG